MMSKLTYVLDAGSLLTLLAGECLPRLSVGLGVRFAFAGQVAKTIPYLYSIVNGNRGPKEPVDLTANLHDDMLELIPTPTMEEISLSLQLREYLGVGPYSALAAATAVHRSLTLLTDEVRLIEAIKVANLLLTTQSCLGLVRNFYGSRPGLSQEFKIVMELSRLRGATSLWTSAFEPGLTVTRE